MSIDVRASLLNAIARFAPRRPGDGGNLQTSVVLKEVAQEIGSSGVSEEAILTAFYDLFRVGYVAWGFNLSNPNPPFFHLTDAGRRSLENLNRDPSNPDGYRAHVASISSLSDTTLSYLNEALLCYAYGLPKAAAVMMGACAECVILELRDDLIRALVRNGQKAPAKLSDWKVKTVLDTFKTFLDNQRPLQPPSLDEAFEANWPAFLLQIRSARNQAGHPANIGPVTIDTVHASLLIFPELWRLTVSLRNWINRAWP